MKIASIRLEMLPVEAVRADISLKGKIRTILLPAKLCRKLLKLARQQKTASGEIFLTKAGKGLSRHQILHSVSQCIGSRELQESGPTVRVHRAIK